MRPRPGDDLLLKPVKHVVARSFSVIGDETEVVVERQDGDSAGLKEGDDLLGRSCASPPSWGRSNVVEPHAHSPSIGRSDEGLAALA